MISNIAIVFHFLILVILILREKKLQSRAIPVVDVSLTLTYRFGIVLGTLGLNTRGCVPACRQEASPKTSQNDPLGGIGPTSCNMPSNPRNHQYLFVPAGETARRDFHSPRPPAKSLEALKCFTLQNQCRPPSVRSPFYGVPSSSTISSSKSHNY